MGLGLPVGGVQGEELRNMGKEKHTEPTDRERQGMHDGKLNSFLNFPAIYANKLPLLFNALSAHSVTDR